MQAAVKAFDGTQDDVVDAAEACDIEVNGGDTHQDAYDTCFTRDALPIRQAGERALERELRALLPELGPVCARKTRALLREPADERNLATDDLVEACVEEGG